MIVLVLQLQGLLVDGGRPRQEAFGRVEIRDANELPEGAGGVTDAHVQVAERVGQRPVARLLLDEPYILLDGAVEPTLAEALLRALERRVPVDGHA